MRTPASTADLPPPPPENLKQRATYWQYRTAWGAVAAMPERLARRLPQRLGRQWLRFASDQQRQQVRANLDRVTRHELTERELDRLVVEAYSSYARYWIDSFRLHTMDAAEVVARSSAVGLEHVDALRDSGLGGIVATGHLGSWDVGAFFTTQRDWGLVVVAEVVEPRRLFERFVRLREQAGIDVVPLVRGGDMLDQLQRRIDERGQVATLLADRDLTKKGPIVDFFGEPCRLPPGSAALARRTGRPVCAGAFFTDGDDYLAYLRPPLDLTERSVYDGTQAVARELEVLIAREPAQWHVFVRNWLADREPDHPVVTAWRRGEDWRTLARDDWERGRDGRNG